MQLGNVLRFLIGVTCTSILAGPTLVTIWPLVGMPTWYGHHDLIPLLVSIPISIFVATPAALINACVLTLLARKGMDALPFSILSGALIGGAVHGMIPDLADSLRGPAAADPPAPHLEIYAVFALAGAIMGMLYWMIAIEPRRRRQRRSPDMADVDGSAQGAPKRIRDGRVPPE